MPWSTPFDEPIALRGGGRLATLQQAADYIMKLPENIQQQERWQIAVENLIHAAETGGGWLMLPRLGVLRFQSPHPPPSPSKLQPPASSDPNPLSPNIKVSPMLTAVSTTLSTCNGFCFVKAAICGPQLPRRNSCMALASDPAISATNSPK